MDKNFFNQTRILDGGMGQQLLAKGLVSKGTLWSTSAILDKKFQELSLDSVKQLENASEILRSAVDQLKKGKKDMEHFGD